MWQSEADNRKTNGGGRAAAWGGWAAAFVLSLAVGGGASLWGQAASGKPASGKAASGKPGSAKPASAKPGSAKPASAKPATAEDLTPGNLNGIPEIDLSAKKASPAAKAEVKPSGGTSREGEAGGSSPEVRRGMAALEGQRWAEAEGAFAEAVAKNGESVEARFHLALAQSLQGKDSEAIANYGRVLQANPELFEAQLNLGVLYLRAKQTEPALEWLGKAVGQRPEQERPNYFFAEAQAAAGNWEEAERHFRKALEANAGEPAARAGLARAIARQGRLKESLPYYREAIAADAGAKPMLLELAQAMEDKGLYAEAAQLYQEFPENAAAKERLGVALLKGGQAAEAVQQLEAAVKKSPTVANRLALATAYLRSQREADALPLLNDAVTLEPKNPELRLALGRIYRQMKQLDKAVGHFAEAVRYDQNSQVAWKDLATTLFLAGQWEGAQSGFARARALGDSTPSLHYLEALCFDRQRLYKQAKASYEAFLAQSKDNPEEEFKARQRLKTVNKELERR